MAGKKKRIAVFLFLICFAVFAAACGKKEESEREEKERVAQEDSGKQEKETREQKKETSREELKKEPEPEPKSEPEPEPEPEPAGNGVTIVIDPGHSAVVEGGQEPVGPGAAEYKAADTSGTSGIVTGIPEYEFTLQVAWKLKAELEARRYTVVMTRESNDVPRSCVQRAEIMNNANASACVRIHANGSENQAARGAMTICTTPSNPYIPQLYEQSRRLSDCILNRMVESTGCLSEGVWETDTMSGNNWSQIPVTIVETGYMTNPEEDLLLASEEYQNQIVQGIANGVDEFIGQ